MATADPTLTTGIVRRRRNRALTVTLAVAAPAIIWLIATAAGADLVVVMGDRQPMAVELPIVLAFSAQAAILGWITLALLERFTARARALWTVLAGAVLLLSFGPLATVTAPASTKLALGLMHAAVGGVLIPFLPRGNA